MTQSTDEAEARKVLFDTVQRRDKSYDYVSRAIIKGVVDVGVAIDAMLAFAARPTAGIDRETIAKILHDVCENDDDSGGGAYLRAADALLAVLNAPAQSSERGAVVEECARVCEEQAKEFLSSEYATGQPLSSFNERFACSECAKAIRALAGETGK